MFAHFSTKHYRCGLAALDGLNTYSAHYIRVVCRCIGMNVIKTLLLTRKDIKQKHRSAWSFNTCILTFCGHYSYSCLYVVTFLTRSTNIVNYYLWVKRSCLLVLNSRQYITHLYVQQLVLHVSSLRPRRNTRFPITHFIKLRSNPCILLAAQCPCLRNVHIHPIPSITSYLGLLSPSLTPSDVDFVPTTYSDMITWVERRGTSMFNWGQLL
jgi:hypothetical protein